MRGMRMVDVTGKDVTARTAVATGVVRTTTEVAEMILANSVPKGDVLAAARLAGIMAVKRTPDLVPLCHPIAIGAAEIDLDVVGAAVSITATVRTADRTGVEMEALTAVMISALTIIDMIKSTDPAASLDQVRVESKSGGKTGEWNRPTDR